MSAAPRFSVIIIFLNEAAYLREAVASVFAQSRDDWELLLVDDGSTDGSQDIAADFARKTPEKVRLLTHPGRENRGMSASRNLGLVEARGKIVGFLDGDDVWTPDKLQEQGACFDAHPEAGMVYGRTLIWHSWEPGSRQEDFFYPLGVEADRLYPPPTVFRVLLANKAQTPTTVNAMMRAELVRRIGGFEDAFRGMFEDQVFFAKALLAAPVFVAGGTWAKYRQHEASHSMVAEREGSVLESRVRFLAWLECYAREQAVADAERVAIAAEARRARWDLTKHKVRRTLGLAG